MKPHHVELMIVVLIAVILVFAWRHNLHVHPIGKPDLHPILSQP